MHQDLSVRKKYDLELCHMYAILKNKMSKGRIETLLITQANMPINVMRYIGTTICNSLLVMRTLDNNLALIKHICRQGYNVVISRVRAGLLSPSSRRG